MKYFNRELSWLAFNERVLQEALDESVPLIERLRFLGIYSNNLDEFYRVRVAHIRRLIQFGDEKLMGYKGTPEELLNEIQLVVIKQQRKFEAVYESLLNQLKEESILHYDEFSVNASQKKQLKKYFLSSVVHDIVPVLLDKKTPFPRLRDKAIYLAIRMEWDNKRKVRFALIEIPSKTPRFYILKDQNEKGFILIDDIIRLHLHYVFPIFSFDTIEAYTFKFTRDAELTLDDDVSLSFVEKMEKSIKQRKKGEPVRLVYDYKMPQDLLDHLVKGMGIKKGINTIPGGKYHNFKDFMKFPDFNRKDLIYPAFKTVAHPALHKQKSIIQIVLKRDLLIHFPYQRFDHVVDLLREAAIDPKVVSIHINIYRVAENSQVMNALVNAVRNGKEVKVIMELLARFDEEHNLYWTERMKEEGATVLFGPQNLKIHSKLIQIKRKHNNKEQLITYIGTGNFNENTAKIYTDMGLLTSEKNISKEVAEVFQMMEDSMVTPTFKHLLVSPVNARQKYIDLIEQESANAKKGLPAYIHMKVNNLVDSELIEKLYEAAESGVEIKLIVRGICCLVPNIKKLENRIRVISIVGQFLEHSRYMIFCNNNNPLYFLTSGDWMERNLDKRIEVGTPIFNEHLKQEIRFKFDTQWADTKKARILDKNHTNTYKPMKPGETPIHSQECLQQHYTEQIKAVSKAD